MKGKGNLLFILFSSSWFLIYIFFCIVYYKERILNLDCSTFFYEIINDNKFTYPGYRMTSIITQLPLRLATFTPLSINTLLFIFSLSFPLIYLFSFLLIHLKFRQPKVAVIMLVSLILSSGYSFYYPVGETFLSIVFSSLLIAVLSAAFSDQKFTVENYIWVIVFLIGAFFSHPSSVIMVFFILGFFFFDAPPSRQKNKLLAFTFLFSTAIIITKLLVFTDAGKYDADLYSQLYNIPGLISGLFKLYPFEYAASRFKYLYLLPSVIFILSLIFLIRSHKIGLLLFGIIYFVFALLLTVIIYNRGDSGVMMERSFMPVVFICVVLFCLIPSKHLMINYLITISAILLSLFSFYRISFSGTEYTNRLTALKEIIRYQRETKQPKLIASWSQLSPDAKFCYWDTPFDVLFLSSIDDGEQTTLYCCDDISQIDLKNNSAHLFLGFPWRLYLDEEILNRKYFNLKSVPYTLLNKKLIP